MEDTMPGKKKRARRTGTYLRSDGRYCAELWSNGRRRFFYGRTADEAEQKRDDARATVRAGGFLPGAVSVGELLDRFLDERASRGCRERTLEGYRYVLNQQIRPLLGQVEARKLTADDVQALVSRQLREGGSPSMVHRTVSHLRMVFKLALDRRTVMIDPTRGVRTPKVERDIPEPLEGEETRKVLQAARAHPLGALWFLGAVCGLRPGEALGLRWRDVDLDGGLVHVAHTLTLVRGEDGKPTVGLGPTKPKRGTREIGLEPAVVAALRARKAQQAAERLAAGAAWSNALGLVFTGIFGQPLDRSTVSKLNRDVLKTAGVRHVRPHDHRHGAATQAHEAGEDLATLSAWLGHSRTSFTVDTYVHARKRKVAGVSSRLAGVLALEG